MKKVLLVVLLLVIVGGFFYLRNSTNLTTTPSPTPTASFTTNLDVLKVVDDFYAAYQSCLSNPEAQSSGRTSQFCQENIPGRSDNFNRNIAENRAPIDPILCAQNPPQSVKADKILNTTNAAAQVNVVADFGSNNIQDIIVNVVSDNGEWQVDNITCPTP